MALILSNQRIDERKRISYKNNEVKKVVYNNALVWYKPYVCDGDPFYLLNADNPKGMPTLNY